MSASMIEGIAGLNRMESLHLVERVEIGDIKKIETSRDQWIRKITIKQAGGVTQITLFADIPERLHVLESDH